MNRLALAGKKFSAVWLFLIPLCLGAFYAIQWRFAYSSDYALIGLVAKRILLTGEQFIFVPTVGYQGLLLEANLVALFFKLFGISPIVLNFAPFFLYLILSFCFYKSVEIWHTRKVAMLSTVLFLVSTPYLYHSVLRTQPNYGETFTFGCILFYLYRKILKSFTENQDKPTASGRRSIWFFLLGLTAGFGMYTYGQIAYFILTIALHLFLGVLQDFFKTYREKPLPRLLKGVLAFSLVYGSLATLSFLTSVDRLQWGSFYLKWKPLSTLFSVILLLGASLMVDFILRRKSLALKLFPYSLILLPGFILGIAPKLYYKWVEHGQSLNRMQMEGSLQDVLLRAKYFITGHQYLFVLDSLFSLRGFVLIFTLATSGVFFYTQSKKLLQWKEISPFFLIYPVAFATFLMASVVVDPWSFRYAEVILFSYSVGTAVIALQCRSFMAVGICLMLLSNTVLLIQTPLKIEKPTHLEKLAHTLEAGGLRYGFGDFWSAYSLTFLTQERLIVEPEKDNYLPFYSQAVLAQDQIFYIDGSKRLKSRAQPGNTQKEIPKEIAFYGQKYEILKEIQVADTSIYTLRKLQP